MQNAPYTPPKPTVPLESVQALRAGLRHVANATRCVAYLELYTRRDQLHGDLEGIQRATAVRYRTMLRRAGLISCGMHCYVPRRHAWRLAELESLA